MRHKTSQVFFCLVRLVNKIIKFPFTLNARLIFIPKVLKIDHARGFSLKPNQTGACRLQTKYFKMSHTHYVKFDRKPTERTTG